jgi:hypothetical protein
MGEVKAPNSPIDTGNKFRYAEGTRPKETNMKKDELSEEQRYEEACRRTRMILPIISPLENRVAFLTLALTTAELIHAFSGPKEHEAYAVRFAYAVKEILRRYGESTKSSH